MCELRWGSGVQAEVGLWAAQAISRIYLTHSRSLSMVGQRWLRQLSDSAPLGRWR